MAITVNKKSCSVSFNFYTSQRYGPKNRILIWNLFWDCRGVAVAPLLDCMSEEKVKLIIWRTVQSYSVADDYMGSKTAEINYLPTCINAVLLQLI